MKKNLVIIFDFDGTIAETTISIVSVLNSLADEFKFKKIKPEDLDNLKDKKTQEIIKFLGISLIKLPFIVKKAKSIFSKEIEKTKPVKGIKETLAFLKKKKYILGILTSNSRENVEVFLRKNNIDLFNFIFSEGKLFNKEKILKDLLKGEKLDSKYVVYIGDETRDIDAAKKAGVKAVAVAWGFNKEGILKKQKPDYLARKPQDLIRILNSL